MNSKEAIAKIMEFHYDYSCIGWCKATEIATIINTWLSSDYLDSNELEVKNNSAIGFDSLESKIKLKKVFLENLPRIVPEHTPWDALNDGIWQQSKDNNHLAIIDAIVFASLKEIQKTQISNLQVIKDVLFYKLGIKSFDDPKTKTAAAQLAIETYFNNEAVDYDKNGLENGIFNDYVLLKKIFLQRLFTLESVVFFINKDVPAVIGIDEKTIGIIWMN